MTFPLSLTTAHVTVGKFLAGLGTEARVLKMTAHPYFGGAYWTYHP